MGYHAGTSVTVTVHHVGPVVVVVKIIPALFDGKSGNVNPLTIVGVRLYHAAVVFSEVVVSRHTHITSLLYNVLTELSHITP